MPTVRNLLAEFPAIVGDGSGTPSPRHGVEHFVETTGRPVFAKARRLDADKLRTAEAEFRSLEQAWGCSVWAGICLVELMLGGNFLRTGNIPKHIFYLPMYHIVK